MLKCLNRGKKNWKKNKEITKGLFCFVKKDVTYLLHISELPCMDLKMSCFVLNKLCLFLTR